MRILGNIKKDKLIVRFMASYLLILVMTMFLGIVGYGYAFTIVEKDINDANLSMLDQSKDILDQKLSNIGIATMQIASNQRIINPLTKDENQPEFYFSDMPVAIEELASYKLKVNDSEFVSDYYVYMKKSNYIVNPETVYKADFYYNNVSQSTNMSYDNWINTLNKEQDGNYIADTIEKSDGSKKNSVIMYLQSLPLNFFNKKYDGTLVVLLNKTGIDQLFSRIDLSKDGWIYIQDKQGKIITTITQNPKNVQYIKNNNFTSEQGYYKQYIGKEKVIVNYCTSPSNGWRYVLVLPDNIVMNKLNSFKRFILVIFIIELVIGILIAYFMAYRNSKPVNNILNQIKDTFGEEQLESKGDAFSRINSTISSLISSNKFLQEKMELQKPLILNAFTDRLLKGEFSNLNEVIANSSYIGINIDGEQYLTLVLRIYDRTDVNEITEEIVHELNTIKLLLVDTFSRYLNNKALYHNIDSQTMAVVIITDNSDNKDKITAIIEGIFDEFVKLYSLKILFGIGTIYSSVLEVWRSYQEALETLNYVQFHKNGKIKWYDDIPKEAQSYYYPMDFEQRIINYVKTGELEQIKNLFSIIIEENFVSRKISSIMRKQLFYEIKGTMIKSVQQIPENPAIFEKVKNLDFEKSIEDSFQRILSIYVDLCNIVTENKSDRNQCVISKITNYIENNYMNQDLSLSLVSSEFHFSEGYLSFFFKEQTGQNFTDFVEQVRMKQACILLEDPELSINYIAEKVGYNSVQSFRRAFKRIKGVSPSALRK